MARHRWMAMVPYELTPEDGLRMIGAMPATPGPPGANPIAGDETPAPDDTRPFLGTHNIVEDMMMVGCFTCEQPLTKDNAYGECPGQPPGELAYVDASGRRAGPEEEVVKGSNVPPGSFTGVGRNEPCPCGSGKKFKHCHGG